MTPIMNFKPKIGSDNLADFELCVNLLSMALKPVDSASIGLGGAARLVEKHHISGSGMKAPEIRCTWGCTLVPAGISISFAVMN